MIPDLMFSNQRIVVDPNEFENSLLNLINEVLKKYCFDRSKEQMDKAQSKSQPTIPRRFNPK